MSVVQTVLGPVEPEQLGHVQMHEHLLCDLTAYLPDEGTADEITLASYFEARVDRRNRRDLCLDEVETAISELALYRASGGGTLVEATSVGLGRDPVAVQEIAEQSGVNVVMGSGYYVAAFHPPELAEMPEDAIAEEIIHDIRHGVGDTGIRAGVIGEIGLSWPPHPEEVKVLRAAAAAQAETGAALLVHPGRHHAAPAHHLRCVIEAGGDVTRTIMSHVDRTLSDLDGLQELADTGCVLEFDLFGTESSYYPPDPSVDLPNDGMRVAYIKALVAAGHGDSVVIAEDVCRKTQLTRYGGEGYAHILRRVLPLMLARGIPPHVIRQITKATPARLLTLAD
ncbi:phosphotriesterase family protein [Nonomuraea lactucae]|uniref:phosphotriesterase family protein n=1 Tax=Nonomuraea lactucae TaxID=2249762 RepID=UPI000DE347A9|nr:aryldialkylphosphatase [Nonomuraea lactucae]